LAGALVLLFVTKPGVLHALGIGSDAGNGTAVGWCVPSGLPEPAKVDFEQVRGLRASLGGVIVHAAGGRLAEGIALPSDMWSDDAPQAPSAVVPEHGLWPAGYEIRWRTRRYIVAADVLLFAEAHTAHDFFEAAAGTNCHREASESLASAPPQARNLTWTNPDGFEQNDVFLLRGLRVYRVADVLDEQAIPLSLQGEAEVIDATACRLPAAGCPASVRAGRAQAHG
jgi:hypothetical protein